VKVLNYPVANPQPDANINERVEQLVMLARALASEIEALRSEIAADSNRNKQLDFDNAGIDFYNEVESYEIELIKSALNRCGGNQTQAAKLLQMKSTTLNAKMKHYGLNPVRSIMVHRPNSQPK